MQHQQQTQLQIAENNMNIAAQNAQTKLAQESQAINQGQPKPSTAPAATSVQTTATTKVSDQLGYYTLQLPTSWTQTQPLQGLAEVPENGNLYVKFPADSSSASVLVTVDEMSFQLFQSNYSQQATGVKYIAAESQNFSESTVIVLGAQLAYLLKYDFNLEHLKNHNFQIGAYGKTHTYVVIGTWTDSMDAATVQAIVNSIVITDH